MENQISNKSWGATLTCCILLGICGLHRFYVGKIGTGILWLLTVGCFGIGAIIDLVMILTGNFKDADGALILPESKKLLYSAVARADIPASSEAQTDSRGIIRMNRIRPDQSKDLESIKRYYAIGMHFEGTAIDELVILLAEKGNVLQAYHHQAGESFQKIADTLGEKACLVGYNLRANFSAFAALLKDVTANGEWDYVDLKELAEYKEVLYPLQDSSEKGANMAIKMFERLRKKYDILAPEKIDGAPLAYRYTVNIEAVDREAAYAAAEAEKWELKAEEINGEVHIFSEDLDVGILREREDMMLDWIKRENPYRMYISQVGDDIFTAELLLYLDRRKGQEDRDQTIVPLINWKGPDAQDALIGVDEGEELDLDEDVFENKVSVTYCGETIGQLPSAIIKRLQNESPYGVWLEKIDETEDFKLKPTVRIFW